METTDANVGDIVLNPKHDFRLDAKNYVILMGKDVTVDAVGKLILFSEDMSYLVGRYVRIHEPTSQLIPPAFGSHIKSLTDTLKN